MSEFSKEFLEVALSRLKLVYTNNAGTALINPLSVVHAFKSGYTGNKSSGKANPTLAGANLAGRTLFGKLACGPLLNITLLGIPFLLHTAYGVHDNANKKKLAALKQKDATRIAAKELKIVNNVKNQVKSAGNKENQLKSMKNIKFGDLKALTSEAYSHVFLPVYHGLLKCGVAEPTARLISQSGGAQKEQSFSMSESDLDGVITFLETYCKAA